MALGEEGMFFTIFSLIEHARDVLELFSEIEE
jgi:hypothetical protein